MWSIRRIENQVNSRLAPNEAPKCGRYSLGSRLTHLGQLPQEDAPIYDSKQHNDNELHLYLGSA